MGIGVKIRKMNEFTKEELMELQWAIIEVRNSHSLYDKLNFLINNYCEHPEKYEDFDYSPMRCKTCKKITE
jgi:hypothetical protein